MNVVLLQEIIFLGKIRFHFLLVINQNKSDSFHFILVFRIILVTSLFLVQKSEFKML